MSSIPRWPKYSDIRLGRQTGFTLLELLVVLVIIGLLAGIVGPRLFANVDKSKETTAKAQIHVLSKAVDQLRLDIGRYPTTHEGLALLMTAPADGTPGWNGPYLKKPSRSTHGASRIATLPQRHTMPITTSCRTVRTEIHHPRFRFATDFIVFSRRFFSTDRLASCRNSSCWV